jgi:hypothetical protein
MGILASVGFLHALFLTCYFYTARKLFKNKIILCQYLKTPKIKLGKNEDYTLMTSFSENIIYLGGLKIPTLI